MSETLQKTAENANNDIVNIKQSKIIPKTIFSKSNPDVENFYRFVYENDLRKEALRAMQVAKIYVEKSLAKLNKKKKRKTRSKAAKKNMQ